MGLSVLVVLPFLAQPTGFDPRQDRAVDKVKGGDWG